MFKSLYLLLFCIHCVVSPAGYEDLRGVQVNEQESGYLYAVSEIPTPVLYTSNFSEVFGGSDGSSLKLDGFGEIDELEFIAFPGTVFEIIDQVYDGDKVIYEVSTEEYPCEKVKGCFVDARFVKTTNVKPSERKCESFEEKVIISRLKDMNGGIYTWGGNYSKGIPEMIEFYTPSSEISNELIDQWTLKGNDCSGLLYEATNGCIPRNTSQLVEFGNALEIQGKSNEEIIEVLEPLDLLVWRGHMAVVIDGGNVIESNVDFDLKKEGFQGGVKIRSLEDFMSDLTDVYKRTPVNSYETSVNSVNKPYVVRRWFGT